tara:strand:+ start:66 stop:650 length:585 start_codon:yes stop_codon:yes gene_type:complete
MQTFPEFYSIPTKIDRDVAELMIKKCETLSLQQSEVFDGVTDKDSPLNVHYKTRQSLNGWIPTDHWISGIMKHLIEVANTELFHYDISAWSDQIQYTLYDQVNSHYTWHHDICESSFRSDFVRKLSISLLLSDPDDYEGGEFQLMLLGKEKMITFKPALGTAIIFPSTAKHRVRPIKSGKRISLVGWYGGPPFR